jgi:hypothetical protein
MSYIKIGLNSKFEKIGNSTVEKEFAKVNPAKTIVVKAIVKRAKLKGKYVDILIGEDSNLCIYTDAENFKLLGKEIEPSPHSILSGFCRRTADEEAVGDLIAWSEIDDNKYNCHVYSERELQDEDLYDRVVEEVNIVKIVNVKANMIKSYFTGSQQILYFEDGRVMQADPSSYTFETGEQPVQINRSPVDNIARVNPVSNINWLNRAR